MTPQAFQSLIAEVTGAIAGKPVDGALEELLNARFPAKGETFQAIAAACRAAIADGWMCENEHGGIRYGRAIKHGPETANFSVDVVQYADLAGPHHRHPTGEIDMIMPITPDAKFDGRGAGWMVYRPDTAHRPTITGGEAIILYLLPDGAMEFTKPS